MRPSGPKTLVLIPAFNEESQIGEVVRRVRTLYADYDVAVVDDGSRDRTGRAAASAGAEVLTHPYNLGYGVAVQTGYKYAVERGYDFLVQMDGDGQHDPESVSALLAPVLAGECDFALGSRFLDGGSYAPPFLRRAGMALFRRLLSALVGQPITDSTSGFQAFNRSVTRFFTTELFPCDYPDADTILTLHRAGFSLREVPVRMHAASGGRSMHGGLKPLYYVFKMSLSIFVTLLRRQERP